MWRKIKVDIITTAWKPLKNNVSLKILPRPGEHLLIESKYYEIISVIHEINVKNDIFIVVEERENNEEKK